MKAVGNMDLKCLKRLQDLDRHSKPSKTLRFRGIVASQLGTIVESVHINISGTMVGVIPLKSKLSVVFL